MNWNSARAQHFHSLRSDPLYRLQERLATLEAENAPSNSLIFSPPVIPPTSFEPTLPCDYCPSHRQFLSLRGEMMHAINKINDHITKAQKEKSPF